MAFSTRTNLITEIQEYSTPYPEEETFKERFVQLLTEHGNCFERSLLKGHITASSWIMNHDRNAVLLLHHAKLNKWLQPGGHADGDEDVRNVALKEAEEETGVKGFEWGSEAIFDLDIHTIPTRKEVAEHEHFDVRFLLIAPQGAQPMANHESNGLEWVSLGEVRNRVGHEASLLRMYAKTLEFF